MSTATISYDIAMTRFKLMKNIAKCALSVGAEIFGGYPRDMLIHDHYATKFYKTKDVDTERYSDSTYLPETVGRLIIPRDIDIKMPSTSIPKFIKKLDDNLLTATEIRSRAVLSSYIDASDQLFHQKMWVGFVMHPAIKTVMNLPRVSVDIVHSDQKKILELSKLDFDCNGLIITSSGDYKLHPHLTLDAELDPIKRMERLQSVMQDILNMRAVKTNKWSPPLPTHRVEKMLSKGWKLVGDHCEAEKCVADEVCGLCLDDFKDSVSIKSQCCNGRLHQKCCMKFLQNRQGDNCMFCRGEHDVDIDFL